MEVGKAMVVPNRVKAVSRHAREPMTENLACIVVDRCWLRRFTGGEL